MEIRVQNKQSKIDLQLNFVKIRSIFFKLAEWIDRWIYS